MAEAWLFKVEAFLIMWTGLSHSGFVSWRFRRRDVSRPFTVFFNLILQSQLFNSVLPYFLVSCPYWGDFPSLFLPAVLSWHLLPSPLPGPTLHGPHQGTRRTREITCTRSRKRRRKKHLEAGWSQGRLEPGTKLKSMFNSSFGSRRCLVNILFGHYKCLYFIACYTVISTTSTFQFPWYLQKYTFWRKRVPMRSYRLRHCHH